MKFLRARIDFLMYVITINKKKTVLFLIDLLIFISLTLYNITQFSINNFIIIVFIINALSLINVIIFIYSSGEKIKELFLTKIPLELRIENIPLQKKVFPSEFDERNNGYENIMPKNYQFIRSREVDDYLLKCDIDETNLTYKINKKYIFQIRKRIRQNEQKLLFLRDQFNRQFSSRPLLNEKKYSLATEIVRGQSIEIYKSTYYDSILSNTITSKKIYRNIDGNEELFFDGTTMLPFSHMKDDSCRLMPIEHSMMNNHVGASVLGLSEDKYLIIFYQGVSSYIDAGSLVPSGNGSADWSDLRNTNGDFIKAIKNSMERELIEESIPNNVKPKINTIIIGYFKWIEMLGKPQFIGLSNININYREIVAKEGLKKPADRDQILFKIDNIDSLKIAINELQNRTGLNASFEYLLFRINELLKRNDSIIEKWINYEF